MKAHQEEHLENAREHYECAALLMEKYPLRATEHLLKCVVETANAASPQQGLVAIENLPDPLFERASRHLVVSLLVRLQGAVADTRRDDPGLAAFATGASEVAGNFFMDVEEHLGQAASPTIRP